MIKIICAGKIKEKYLNELISDYQTRINKYHKIEIIEVKDSSDYREEVNNYLKVINSKDYNIALTIDGTMFDSEKFASHINNLFNYNGTITFIIGPSTGLDKQIIALTKEQISFSSLTFPHGLFRGILLEQIYRAFKINNNETYHK